MSARRYPLQNLQDAAGLTPRQLRTQLGISHSRHVELDHRGLTDEAADRYAIRLGLYPWQVWPTWLTDGLNPDDATRGVPPSPSSSEQP